MISQTPANYRYSTETCMNSLNLDTRGFDPIVQETRNENREGERNHTYCAFIREAQKYVAQMVQTRQKATCDGRSIESRKENSYH